MLNAIEANGFKMISNEAITITLTSRICIDHGITQNLQCYVNVLKHQSYSDHESLLVTWNALRIETNLSSYRDCSFLRKADIFEL